jgi:hypothetical protein
MVAGMTADFAWVEIIRDKHVPFDRQNEAIEHHRAMAIAKNYIVSKAVRTRPDLLLMWDTDFLLPPGAVEEVERTRAPLCGVWAWMNRQKPGRVRYVNPESGVVQYARWEPPVQTTAMEWGGQCRAKHLAGADWNSRCSGTWKADVVLGFQAMSHEVYMTTSYREHIDGEDIPFHWSLESRGVPRYIKGEIRGVHLYRPDAMELEMGWPDVMGLAKQSPLSSRLEPLDRILGYYPEEE